MKVKIIKFNQEGKLSRAHYNDSGADCFANEDVVIMPGKIAKVPTGIGVELPDGYDMVVHCKSGLSSKGIWASNAPIDSGYRGEIHAILFNTTSEPYIFKKDEKIGQLVMRPVIYPEFVDDLDDKRGANGFGSSGK